MLTISHCMHCMGIFVLRVDMICIIEDLYALKNGPMHPLYEHIYMPCTYNSISPSL